MSKLLGLMDNPNFNPQQLADLKLWLDSSDAGTITKNGSNFVSQWNDKSGRGHNAVQGTGAAQPLYTAVSINSKAAMTFDTANNMSITHHADFNFTNGATFFFVGDTSSIDAVSRRFLSKVGAFAMGKAAISTDARFTTSGVKDYDSAVGFFAANTPIVTTFLFDSAFDVSFYKNGSLFETIAFNIAANTSGNDLIISSLTEQWNGRMAEILFYNRELSAREIKLVNRYLEHKWGVIA